MSVLQISKNNFDELKENDKTVLIDFFARWCGPCRTVSPIVEEIAEENPKFLIAKIDVDQEPELAAEFDVRSIPTLMVMKKGKVVQSAVGAKTKDQILEMLEKAPS